MPWLAGSADGEAVVRQGEMGDTFFFVEEGEAIVTQTQSAEDGQLRDITVGHLTKGDYFGGNVPSSLRRQRITYHLLYH
jgi:CRP-like cAMP-binding protein